MNTRFSFDGNTVAYLLHGQDLILDIQAKSCWCLLIRYNSGKGSTWSLHRPGTRYATIANAYHPKIKVWGIGWGIKKLLDKKLNINFLNTIEQKMKVHCDLPLIKTGKPKNPKQVRLINSSPFLKYTTANFVKPSPNNIRTNPNITINTEIL